MENSPANNGGLLSLTYDELCELLRMLGQEKYRAKQIFKWLHTGARPGGMTNIKKELREQLNEMPYGGVEIANSFSSKKDETKKFLFKLSDNNLIEGVLMSYNHGRTLCISTQVGCNMKCAFCSSALGGCVRNLTAGEMLSQVLETEKITPLREGHIRAITNIVLMGSGEPLDNYDNTVRFLSLVTDSRGMNISPRNISLSTCGIVPNVLRLIDDAPYVTLSISLHAPNDAIRSEIMPVNKAYPISEVLDAAKKYAEDTKRRVIFEYALIEGVNDRAEQARELAYRLRGINAHVNLITLNSVLEAGLSGSSSETAREFCGLLTRFNVSATVRRTLGSDIEGACGQLRRRILENGGI